MKRTNVTISISLETVKKAKVLAARRSTSISRLLAEQIEFLVGEEEAWAQGERTAIALLEQGIPMGGQGVTDRGELHER